MSPKPFSPSKAPFEPVKQQFTPVQSPLSLPNGTDGPFSGHNGGQQSVNYPQPSAVDDFPSVFPRPPPPQMSLIGDPSRSDEPVPRSKSPVVPNPPIAYMPNLQEQWLAKKQGSVSPTPGQQPMATNYNRSDSYDRKMHDIRESGTRYLPANPALAYAPTLQEQW